MYHTIGIAGIGNGGASGQLILIEKLVCNGIVYLQITDDRLQPTQSISKGLIREDEAPCVIRYLYRLAIMRGSTVFYSERNNCWYLVYPDLKNEDPYHLPLDVNPIGHEVHEPGMMIGSKDCIRELCQWIVEDFFTEPTNRRLLCAMRIARQWRRRARVRAHTRSLRVLDALLPTDIATTIADIAYPPI